jgi:glycosyltransferase involved in cell wall biosynthesis
VRIGIAKPDFGVQGGFELVLIRLAEELMAAGHEVGWLTVDARVVRREPYGVHVPAEHWETIPEFWRYVALASAFEQLDASAFDLVLATQPPSFAVHHPHRLALFFHHQRVFYDLSEAYVAAGFVPAALHLEAQRHVRLLDEQLLAGVDWFLAGSEHVRERLRDFNDIVDNVSVCQVGLRHPVVANVRPGGDDDGPVLCVTRHEFPKRGELFVKAAKLLPDVPAVAVGDGGRLAWARTVDALLSEPGADPDELPDESLWLRDDRFPPPLDPPATSNVRFAGRVGDDELDALYRSARCVVAPAYLEDYGLTALEAMSYGTPVVVCRDGGGLADLVEDGVTGFVVEPTAAAIAAAVRRVLDDRALAERMGEAGRAHARRFTWERTMADVQAGIEQVVP